jgi:lipoteichoic acid synthase
MASTGSNAPGTRSRSFALILAFLAADAAKLLLFRRLLAGGSMNLNNYLFIGLSLCAWVALAWPLVLAGGRRSLFSLAYAAQAAYLFSNLTYYEYYHAYLTVSSAQSLFKEAAAVAGAGGVPLRPGLIALALADLPFAALLFAIAPRARNAVSALPRRAKAAWLIAALACALGACAYRLADDPFAETIGRATMRPSYAVNAYGLLAYQVGSYFLNERTRSSFIEAMEPKGPERAFAGRATRAGVAVIQVESLGAEVVGLDAGGKPVTPYLRRLASESVYYPYALVYRRGGGTSDTEVAVIASTETIANYPAIDLPLDYRNSFVKVLKAEGYATAIYHGNAAAYFHRDKAFPAMGFDRYESLETMGLDSAGWGAPDGEVFGFVLAEAKASKATALRYIITMSSHGPYTNVMRYYAPPFPRGGMSEIEYRYLASMSYVDRELERAVASLEAAGAGTVIIFGDHPDYYVEGRDRAFARAKVKRDGATREYVPLFIIAPGEAPRREAARAASLLDIAPTVLAASGARGSIRSFGENLLAPGGPTGPIVFRGSDLDRSELYAEADAVAGKPLVRGAASP